MINVMDQMSRISSGSDGWRRLTEDLDALELHGKDKVRLLEKNVT